MRPDERVETAAQLLGPRVERDVPFGPMTTYRIGGNAALLYRVRSLADLWHVSSVLSQVDIDVVVAGRGSNMLVSDDGFGGLVLVLAGFVDDVELPERGSSDPEVCFGGGVALPVAARLTVGHGLSGFEWAVGVPGSIGGAVRMNAGGHGSDMATSLESVRLFHLKRGLDVIVSAVDLGMRFRGSALTDDHVVLSATVRLEWADDPEEGDRRLADIVSWRREHQPGGQNAGSVFVNPEPDKVSAGALIDVLGLRGFRIGSAQVSPKHANFIQADEGGSALDVLRVMSTVRERVKEAHGYDLRSEIRLLGFADTEDDRIRAVAAEGPDVRVATIRLEQAIERASVPASTSTADHSIPVATLEGRVTAESLDGLTPEAMEELREVFAGDVTAETGRPSDVVVGDAGSEGSTEHASPRGLDDEVGPASGGVDDTGRVVIVDDDLRLADDVAFPQDEHSRTVHVAPTSQRIIITDDTLGEDGQRVAELVEFDVRTSALKRLFTRRRTGSLSVGARRKAVLFGVGATVVLVLSAVLVLASPLVAVERVDVEGATYADAALIESVVESMKGISVLTVDTQSARRRLEADPWIASARISTYLPDRVLIELEERRPAAWFLGVDNRARVIDVEGRVLAVVEGRPTEFTWIDGVGPNLVAGSIADPAYRAAAQLAMSLPDEIEPLVDHLGVTSTSEVTMTLTTGTVVNFGQPVDMRNKLVSVVVLLRRQDPNKIIAIDVSGGTPVVQSS
jgi:UDP-N-acetylmuramate dehydrogenase